MSTPTGTENKTLNKRILKAFGLFGSVQGMLILFSILRTKAVAVLLGSSGIGLFNLFLSAIELVGTTTQLSLSESAVRNISGAKSMEDKNRIITSVLRWSRVLGAVGAAVMLVSAPFFSYFTFGDYSWTVAYVVLSVVVFLNAVTKGFTATLQGLEAFKNLASAQVYGAAGGLIVSIPLFYFLKMQSIVPSFIAYALFATVAFWLIYKKCARRNDIVTVKEPLKDSLKNGVPVIRLGAYMTVSTFASLAASYIFMAWLNENSSTSTVGFFNAGFTIVNRYVGVLLSAIAVEYYPRLARELSEGKPIGASVEAEINLGLPLLLPCVCLFMLLSPFIVNVLYTSEFNVIVSFVNWAMIGTMLRLLSYCYAYVILAKGDGKIYVVTEVISAIVYVVSSILCYKAFGITGLGYSYIIWYALYAVSVIMVYRLRYHLPVNPRIWLNIALSLTVSVIAISAVNSGMYVVAIILTAVTGAVALRKVRTSF